MREIVLDTETTGFDPQNGDRIVEIGAVELVNHIPTGKKTGVYHQYINPERDMPVDAFNVHGLSEEFLVDKPVFAAIVDEFIEFIGDATLIIHNASFDMKFINAELAYLSRLPLPMERTIDTVQMARRKFPGAPASLDALCRRFGIDNSARTKHGALLDAEILAEVYLELIGGREPGLALGTQSRNAEQTKTSDRPIRPPRPYSPSSEEDAAHREFMKNIQNPLWLIEEASGAGIRKV